MVRQVDAEEDGARDAAAQALVAAGQRPQVRMIEWMNIWNASVMKEK